jgi:hypothetical protein
VQAGQRGAGVRGRRYLNGFGEVRHVLPRIKRLDDCETLSLWR